MRITAILVMGLFVVGGCATSWRAEYVRADRLTKRAVEPKLMRYASEHPEDAAAVRDLMESWERRLVAAER